MTLYDLTCEYCGRQETQEEDDICRECQRIRSSDIPTYDDYCQHDVSGLIEE